MRKAASYRGDHPVQSLLCFHDVTWAKAAAHISARQATLTRPGAGPGQPPQGETRAAQTPPPPRAHLICISNASQRIHAFPLQLLPIKTISWNGTEILDFEDKLFPHHHPPTSASNQKHWSSLSRQALSTWACTASGPNRSLPPIFKQILQNLSQTRNKLSLLLTHNSDVAEK